MQHYVNNVSCFDFQNCCWAILLFFPLMTAFTSKQIKCIDRLHCVQNMYIYRYFCNNIILYITCIFTGHLTELACFIELAQMTLVTLFINHRNKSFLGQTIIIHVFIFEGPSVHSSGKHLDTSSD